MSIAPVVSVSSDLYLDLLKACLTRSAFPERYHAVVRPGSAWKRCLFDIAFRPLGKILGLSGLALVRKVSIDPQVRASGRDMPEDAETMIGLKRLDNLHACVESVLRDNVHGDLIETGVWRGGAGILMRAILKLHGDTSRTVWMADSFEGLPKPNPERYPADADSRWHLWSELAISEETVRRNFERYGLLDRQVQFLRGWFRDTLPTAPIKKLAVLRLDGDMYESTIDALTALYPKLSSGGYCIVDDYAWAECRRAVEDYRNEQGIREPVRDIDDGSGAVFWRRSEPSVM